MPCYPHPPHSSFQDCLPNNLHYRLHLCEGWDLFLNYCLMFTWVYSLQLSTCTCFLLISWATSECCLPAVRTSFSCSACRSVKCSLNASNTLLSTPGDWLTTPVKAGLFCRAIMASSRLIPSMWSLLFRAMFLISARATKSWFVFRNSKPPMKNEMSEYSYKFSREK